jgi:RNA polymerase sigma-70 factor, ECF subfamily
MDFHSTDDAELLAIIAGVPDSPPKTTILSHAVGTLYDRYGHLVYTVAYNMVGDQGTAEEITQDVFIKVWEKASTYRPDMAKFSSWLISIARHCAIDELRRRGVRAEKNSVELPEEEGETGESGLLPTLDGPEELVETAMQQENIQKVISTLPEDQGQVLRLAFFKGLSQSEIASQLGEPLGTVKSRIRLAMQKMREMMIEKGITE